VSGYPTNQPLPPVRLGSDPGLFIEAARRSPQFPAEAQAAACAAYDAARRVPGLSGRVAEAWTWFQRRMVAVTSPGDTLRVAVEAGAVMLAFATLPEVHRRALSDAPDGGRRMMMNGTEIAADIARGVAAAMDSHEALTWYAAEREQAAAAADRANRLSSEAQLATFKRDRPAALLGVLRGAGVVLVLAGRPAGLAVLRGGVQMTARQAAEVSEHRVALIGLLEQEAHAAEPVAV